MQLSVDGQRGAARLKTGFVRRYSVRIVEVRRHSLTKKGKSRAEGSHLSQQGVELARQVGSKSGHFDLVFASSRARSSETALAMGFSVAEKREELGRIPDEVQAVVPHHEQWNWRDPFLEYAVRMRGSEALSTFARSQSELWQTLARLAPDQGSVLVITHGGVLEPALVASLPSADHRTWGAPFSHCEGARLVLEDEVFADMELLRLNSSAWDYDQDGR